MVMHSNDLSAFVICPSSHINKWNWQATGKKKQRLIHSQKQVKCCTNSALSHNWRISNFFEWFSYERWKQAWLTTNPVISKSLLWTSSVSTCPPFTGQSWQYNHWHKSENSFPVQPATFSQHLEESGPNIDQATGDHWQWSPAACLRPHRPSKAPQPPRDPIPGSSS